MLELTNLNEKAGALVPEFNRTQAALAVLATLYGKPESFDVTTPDGMKAAKAGKKELVSYRTNLEKARKEFKAPVLDLGRAIDDQAKAITTKLLELESPLADHIGAEEARQEHAAQEAKRIEAERVAAIQGRLQRIRDVAGAMVGKPLATLRTTRNNLEGVNCNEFDEFEGAARISRDAALTSLDLLITGAELAERQAAELEEMRRKLAESEAEKAAVVAAAVGVAAPKGDVIDGEVALVPAPTPLNRLTNTTADGVFESHAQPIFGLGRDKSPIEKLVLIDEPHQGQTLGMNSEPPEEDKTDGLPQELQVMRNEVIHFLSESYGFDPVQSEILLRRLFAS